MMNFALQKLRYRLDDDTRFTDDRMFSWFLVFIFGLICGCLFFDRFDFCSTLYLNGMNIAVLDAVFVVLLLLFSTSYLGSLFIPALVSSRAFLLAASVSALYSYFDSGDIIIAIYSFAIPSLIVLPCFFVFSDDCARLSRELFDLRFNCGRSAQRILFFKHFFLLVLILLFDFIYCIYFMPLLVA